MLAVLGALFANELIVVLKFVAALVTGSSGMMEKIFLATVLDRDDSKRVGVAEQVG